MVMVMALVGATELILLILSHINSMPNELSDKLGAVGTTTTHPLPLPLRLLARLRLRSCLRVHLRASTRPTTTTELLNNETTMSAR